MIVPRVISVALGVAIALSSAVSSAEDEGHSRHVLLISIDGMHALDFQNCTAAGTCPNLAALAHNGVSYRRTSTSKPSDSFPGLMSIVTGGSPALVGAWYDVAYDRVLAPPAIDTGNGVLGGSCAVGVVNGTRTEYEEGVDFDQTLLNGGGPGADLDGTAAAINPQRLPRDPFQNCQPVYPWNFIRANTIFGVVHQAGGYVAWSDKHPVYAAVSGPTGTSKASNLDDFYGPEINSSAVPLAVTPAGTSLDCTKVIPTPPAVGVNNPNGDYTTDFDYIKCYDQLKVNAVMNWIDGYNHLRTQKTRVPTLFGMNFQAVSVGEKLIKGSVKGGYTDAQGEPTPALLGEIKFVDAAIGSWVAELRRQGLSDSTTIIVTAKHGQSPIDPNRFLPIPGHAPLNNGMPPSAILGPAYLPDSELNQIGSTEDDISLLWLSPGASTANAVNLLESNSSPYSGLGQIFWGPSLQQLFDKPGLPFEGGDPRTPDIIVQPNVGVIYTGSLKKQAEHGGFAQDDTNVMLLISNPSLRKSTVTSFVETAQVAPTVLRLLGHDPDRLEAVRKEGTPVLPGLFDQR
jgi:hypothetical protein